MIPAQTEIDYLETYAANPGDIYGASSIDDAMKNCYTQTRKFLMAKYGLTDAEAATFITVGVDFATTQLVDGRADQPDVRRARATHPDEQHRDGAVCRRDVPIRRVGAAGNRDERARAFARL